MPILLLERSLKVDVFFDSNDRDYKDDICLSFIEECPGDEKIFLYDETNLYLTREQAVELAQALLKAAQNSQDYPG